MNDIPRHNRLDLNTPAELAIRAAVEAVEVAGCHPLLTDAVNLLHEARMKVAAFVDGLPDSPLPMTDKARADEAEEAREALKQCTITGPADAAGIVAAPLAKQGDELK